MASHWKYIGTQAVSFLINSISSAAVMLKAVTGGLALRNKADSADVALTVSKISVSGEVIDINSDAVLGGADWKYTLQRPTTGMTASVALTLPPDGGTAGYVLQSLGGAVTAWAAAAATDQCLKEDTTTIGFAGGVTTGLFTLPINAVIYAVRVVVDTAFNGTAPTISVGIVGTVSKYFGTGDADLKTINEYGNPPGLPAVGTTEALIATYAADSSSAGSCRVIVSFSVPM